MAIAISIAIGKIASVFSHRRVPKEGKVYAGSGLPQGPFWRTIYLGFCQWAEMGPKVGFWVPKWVKVGRNPLLTHFEAFRDFRETHFLASLREVEVVL